MNDCEAKILAALQGRVGLMTREIADAVMRATPPQFGRKPHPPSTAVLSWLKSLEKCGKVERLVASSPIVWRLAASPERTAE